MISIQGTRMVISTHTTTVVFEDGRLVSIGSAGRIYVDGTASPIPALELLHMSGKTFQLGQNPIHKTTNRQLSDTIAEIKLDDWDADVTIRVSTDNATGDILVEPSCYSIISGLQALRMNICGIQEDVKLVLPLQQGALLDPDNAIIANRRFEWPNSWEAGFAVFAAEGSGFSVQAWDSQHCGKAIKAGGRALGFETCARGPLESVKAVGGLVWRIGAYVGDWTTPVKRYRDWYWQAYGLEKEKNNRPDWLGKLKLAVSWCPTQMRFLDELKKLVDPTSVFIHLPNWRPYSYDQDYPMYTASEEGRAFIIHARELGYHVAPHCNAYQISPDHPMFAAAVNFSPRHITDRRLLGWSWLPVEGWKAMQGPPQSYSTIGAHKDYNVLVNVHPGWSLWRRELEWQIASARQDLSLDSVFIDVAQLIYDGDPSIIENMTYSQGSLRMIREITDLAEGFCVSGEARNEINGQSLSVNQLHLFDFAHAYTYDNRPVDWLTEISLPVNDLLFKGLNRGFGYSYGTKEADRRVMINATAKIGALPTLIFEGEDYLNSAEAKYILSMMG